MADREPWVVRTFLELSDTLITDFDVIDFLSVLVQRMVELVDAADAGLVLADRRGGLRVMASSSERMRVLELFEIQGEEGPCLDCFISGARIVNVALWDDDAKDRWPRFAAEARAAGYRHVHAFPLRLRDQVIGAANLFDANERLLEDDDIALLQALTDIATISLLQERTLRQATEVADQLEAALVSRVIIEQATGVLAERLTLEMDDAFATMRRHARRTNSRLSDVARSVVDGTLSAQQLVAGQRPGGAP